MKDWPVFNDLRPFAVAQMTRARKRGSFCSARGEVVEKNARAKLHRWFSSTTRLTFLIVGWITTPLARAEVRLNSLRHVFITHHHSDHNAEYRPLLLLPGGTDLPAAIPGDRSR